MRAGAEQAGQLLEVACDESGSEGENLIGGNTDVFAHAGVRLDIATATSCIQEVRDRIRSPATEYKANHLLREKHRSVLTWLLGPLSPIFGNAHVHLVDKACFVVGRIVELLNEDAAHRHDCRHDQVTAALCRDGGPTFGHESWQAFLTASNNLLRTKNRPEASSPVDSFFRTVDVLLAGNPRGTVADIMDRFRQARPRAEAFRAQLLDHPQLVPSLDPLIPSIVRTVAYWSGGAKPVSIVHDRQTVLTQERIAQLEEVFRGPASTMLNDSSPAGLAGFRLVAARSDARVQIADFLAGVARKIASDELNNRGDAELTALLRPYVDSCSIWGDERSWSMLRPT